MQTAERLDLSTLAWIKGELEATLKEARGALEAYAEQGYEGASLDACAEACHQVRGTLQMVELDGAERFLAEAEALLTALRQGQVADGERETAAEVLMRAILQLPDYLEGLQGGRPDSLLPLLPLVNEMRAARGAPALPARSEFHPDLDVQPPRREGAGDPQGIARKARPYYQTSLANLLRGHDTAASLNTLSKVLDALLKATSARAVRQTFWVAAGVVEALQEGGIALSREIKQLLGKLDQLIKYLARNGEAGLKAENVEALSRLLLFELGASSAGGPLVAGIREAFGLERLFAPVAGGELNAELKRTVAADILEELADAKDTLDVFVRGSRSDAEALVPILAGLRRLADTLDLLRQDELKLALDEQAGVLDRIRRGELQPDDEVLMGVAGALLLVESRLQDWGSDRPVERGDTSATSDLAGDDPEYRRVIRQAMKEAREDLVRIRGALSAFLDDPGDRQPLTALQGHFHRLIGSLELLSYSRLAKVLRASALFVRDEIAGADQLPPAERLDRLAEAVMSAEYYLEAFAQSRVHPGAVLDVAEQALETLGYRLDALPDALGAEELVAPAPVEPAEPAAAPETAAEAEPAPEPDGVDDEITQVFLEEADEELAKLKVLLPRWQQDRDDEAALADYRRCFHTLKGSGRLVGAEPLGEFAWAVENMLNRVIDGSLVADATVFEVLHAAERVLPGLVEQFRSGAQPPAEVQTLAEAAHALARGEAVTLPPGGEGPGAERPALNADPELLEIYGKEATGHLDAIEAFLAETGARQPSEALLRALHTLKGSSRIAGAGDIAAVAEALENYAKALQTVHRPVADEGLVLLAECAALGRGILAHLADPAQPFPAAGDLPERARALYGSVRHLESEAAEPELGLAGEDAAADPEADGAHDAPGAMAEAHALWDYPDEQELELAALDAAEVGPATDPGPPEAGPGPQSADPLAAATLDEDEEVELADLFLAEAGEILERIHVQLERWFATPGDTEPLRELQRHFHTLKGSARLAGIGAMGDLADGLEGAFAALLESPRAADVRLREALRSAPTLVATMLEQVGRGEPLGDPAAALAGLSAALAATEAAAEGEDGTAAAGAPHGAHSAGDIDPDTELLELFLEEGREILDRSERTLQAWTEEPDDPSAVQSLQRDLHTLKGSARMAGVSEVADLGHALESAFEAVADGILAATPELLVVVQQAQDRLSTMLDQVWNREPVASGDDLVGRLAALGDGPAAEPPDETAPAEPPATAPAAKDIADGVGAYGAALRSWQEQPASVERQQGLASVVAGIEAQARAQSAKPLADIAAVAAMLLGRVQDGHVFISEELFGLLHLVHERLAALTEQHQQGLPPGEVQDLIDSMKELIGRHAASGDADDTGLPALGRRRAPRMQHDMVRVRRDLLDGLVNHAGEVSIYRSRVEQQLNAFGSTLEELHQTVERLREQLRKFDIEHEAQIASRYQESNPQYEEFDPLEFDRFTNMQLLSRAMMESLSDIRSLEEIMAEIGRESETLLLQQARVNTELQESLMQTRMVQLVENAPRLRRIVRQTGAELGRKANLSFSGAEVEMDRRVVERLLAPLEHMLRNAIAHGIETPEDRAQAGKPEEGRVTIALAHEGAEVVLQVFDDGRGIDVEAVRRKAVERGLMPEGAELDAHEVMQFILEAGFSTAASITQVAGRGVGMDVVASEIRQLGGSLEIDSEAGRGTRFTIRLPLSLSVSRALVVQAGEETFAIPLLSVQGIERVAPGELERLRNAETPFQWLGEDYRLLDLREVLGLGGSPAPVETAKQPLLLARSGEHRVALMVDHIEGSREVVVKSVGRQLSTLQTLAGATILADGSVCLVLELPALIRRGAGARQRPEAAPSTGTGDARSATTVMIVDDSITVRAVTKRLLKRHDLNAVAAKDGVDALALLEETVPDLILLDIEMPRMDGFELASHLRNSDAFQHIPIIMITSRTGDKHRQRAQDIGVDAYMGKPYSEGDLMANIEALLERRPRAEGGRDE